MLRIERYKPVYQQAWNDFVKASRNGTFMQQQTFLSYHPPGRFSDTSLLVYGTQGDIIAVIPAAQKNDGAVFASYPGASHGGIIVDKKFGVAEAMGLIPDLIAFCRDNNFQAIEIKMTPRIYHGWPSDEIDFALRYHGFAIVTTELATALPLKEISGPGEYLPESSKRNIRKAQKLGVIIEESCDVASFWDILSSNLTEKHQAHPTHSLEEIRDLMAKFPQGIKLFGAFYQGVMVAGVVAFLLNNRVINCFYIASNYQYQQLRSLDLLFFTLIRWGMENGYHYLDWGISTENKGLTLNQGLFHFKEKFGGRGVLREMYYLNLK